MTVKIHYLDTSKDLAVKSLLLDGNYKDKLLDRLGVIREPEESHIDAWGKHLHKINNLPFTKPYHHTIVDAIFDTPGAYRFMFVLA